MQTMNLNLFLIFSLWIFEFSKLSKNQGIRLSEASLFFSQKKTGIQHHSLFSVFILLNFPIINTKYVKTLFIFAFSSGPHFQNKIKEDIRVLIINKEDVWYKTEWKSQIDRSFKKNDLMIIRKT